MVPKNDVGSAIDDGAPALSPEGSEPSDLDAPDQRRDRHLEELHARNLELNHTIDDLRGERDEARTARATAEEKIAALELRLADARNAESQAQRNSAETVEKLKQRLDAAVTREGERTRELEISKQREKELRDKLDTESRRGQELDASVKRAVEEADTNERALASSRQEIAALGIRLEESTQKANEAEQEATRANQELRQARQKYDELSNAVGTAADVLVRARNKT